MSEKKICTDCKQPKFLAEFAKNVAKPDGRNNMCKACKKVYNAAYYVRTKEIHNPSRAEARKLHKKELQTAILTFLKDHPCVDCGETDPIVLQFDHQRDKSADVSQMVNQGMPWSAVLAEIEKCEVVCANDHQRRTAKQFGWYKLLKH